MNPKEQIKQSLSILDVVSTYVRLEKSGSQYKARCPFHNEKTPSFYISLERGTYHCFGCQEHGDIFTFVEKMEAVPFYEALTILAERAGIKLTPYKKAEKDKENNLINLIKAASIHYVKNLEKSIEAKKYLNDRGLTNETIQRFDLGFSLGGNVGWRDLFISLAKDGFTIPEMIASGMVIKKEGEEKYFDRFRGRIMFPIKNTFNNIVGFTARILPSLDDGKMGKYINSPETDIYHKSKILFGYNLAKKSIAEKREVILVEGQMDMIMSHQVGVLNVVATSGTAVTEEHIQILKRFADRILLSFDQDSAGEEAMKKCALLALYGGLDVYIIPKKENIKDVADLIKEYGGEIWQKLIQEKEPLIIYLVENIFKKISDNRERNKEIRKEILPYLRAYESDMERGYFIKYLANKLNIQELNIINDLKKVKVQTQNISVNEITKENVNNGLDNNSKLIKTISSILAILKWKNIKEEKFLKEYFEDIKDTEAIQELKIDFKDIWLESKKDLPLEIIEAEIIKIEKEISTNLYYQEHTNKFINNLLFDFVKRYKMLVLDLEIKNILNKVDKHEEDLKRIIFLQKLNQQIQHLKFRN